MFDVLELALDFLLAVLAATAAGVGFQNFGGVPVTHVGVTQPTTLPSFGLLAETSAHVETIANTSRKTISLYDY